MALIKNDAFDECHRIIDHVDANRISATSAIAILGMTLPVKHAIESRGKFTETARVIIANVEGSENADSIVKRYS